jgi:hypothetical protein
MKRVLSPSTNSAGLTSLIAALYALGYGCWNVAHHRGAVDPQVIVAALSAVAALFTRQVVTPVTSPRDGAGRPLKTADQFGAEQLNAALAARSESMVLPQPSARRKPPQPAATPDAGTTP